MARDASAFLVTLALAFVVAIWLIARLWRMVMGIFRRHSLRPEPAGAVLAGPS